MSSIIPHNSAHNTLHDPTNRVDTSTDRIVNRRRCVLSTMIPHPLVVMIQLLWVVESTAMGIAVFGKKKKVTGVFARRIMVDQNAKLCSHQLQEIMQHVMVPLDILMVPCTIQASPSMQAASSHMLVRSCTQCDSTVSRYSWMVLRMVKKT